jgi:hypothetical protein
MDGLQPSKRGKPGQRAAAWILLDARRACVCAILADCDSAIIDDGM